MLLQHIQLSESICITICLIMSRRDQFNFCTVAAKDRGADVDVHNRIAKSSQAFGVLNRMWTSTQISKKDVPTQIFKNKLTIGGAVLVQTCTVTANIAFSRPRR